ncbi:hypothetical protein B5F76_10810 [Desulfovibrio sp. An276]|nr:hypothetical protein B5F76_10810 [Desulfovibrio sp. An276]
MDLVQSVFQKAVLTAENGAIWPLSGLPNRLEIFYSMPCLEAGRGLEQPMPITGQQDCLVF